MEDIQQAVSSAVQSGWLKALTLERLAGVLLLVLVGLLTIRVVLKLTDRLLDRAKSLTGVRIYIRTAVQAVLWLLLGLGRPLRAVLAALCWYGSLFTAVMAFPLSGAYLLLIGFSVPCLLGNFFLRTVLKPYCPPVSE